ncbi:helix-turn-helix domain-containing protein [Neorhizobium sp. DAR64860/K0K1]|uniref:helix-turn-helix domain-containing protein n=1 Tax=Neorhizobium sp. DAR64860/K0K1 TaxID=3421955 RepID=UPI003D28562B
MGLLTPKQAAAELAISSRQLRDLSLDGDIAFINVGRGERPARRYEMSDLEAFKAERRTISCRSSSVPAQKRTATTSGIKVIDFEATLAAQRSKKLSSKKATSKAP